MRVLCQAECRIDPNGDPSHEGVEKNNFLLLLQKSGFDFWRRLGRGKAKSSCATQFEGAAHTESLFFQHPPDGVTCPENFGLYFAVHPCPDDMLMSSVFYPAGQWTMMKKSYQIL